MNTKTNYVALIPLRGGSKNIPKKNIKHLAGYPLCCYSIKAAINSKIFNKVIISTDSYEIAGTCEQYFGNQVIISMRPNELATDNASTESVMFHIMDNFEFDVLCTIQATSPLTTAQDFILAKEKFEKEKSDSLVTGVISKRFFWNYTTSEPINYNPLNRPRRQEFDGWFMENGAFYFSKKEILEKYKCRLGGKISLHEMPEETAMEIDEIQDWIIIEQLLLSKRKGNLSDLLEKVSKIKMIITDVDGTLTDAGMYYTNQGDFMKKFNTRDAMGLKLIEKDLNIPTIICTREDIDIVKKRADKLGFEAFLGVKDKKSFLNELITKKGLKWDEIAYFGDDLNDLECMQSAGFAGCPANAEESILKTCHFISSKNGGEGAIREICNFILENRLNKS